MSAPALWCVIPAAGSSQRFGGDTPKQFLECGGHSVLEHTLNALLSHPRVSGVMLALPAGDTKQDIEAMHGKPVHVCEGGPTRARSVANGLRALEHEGIEGWVLVHDAARPNLLHEDLDALIAACEAHAVGAILAAPARDTMKRVDANGNIVETVPRDVLWRALTPQMFRLHQLLPALEDCFVRGVEPTDESMAMEQAGFEPCVVEGREDNFKITTPPDLVRFRQILRSRAA